MGVLDRVISNLRKLKSEKDVILARAVVMNEPEIVQINKDQLQDSQMVDESPITWGRDSFKHTTYQRNKKNTSKGRTGKGYKLFDSGSLYSGIKTEVTNSGLKLVNRTGIGDTVAKYYNGPTNYLGIQRSRYGELRKIISRDVRKELIKRFK